MNSFSIFTFLEDLSSKNISLTVETPNHKETIYFQPEPEVSSGGSNPAGLYPNYFPNPEGQS